MKKLLTALMLLFVIPNLVYGTGNDDCDHPRFLEKGCGHEGDDGEDGADGKDGRDGIDGRDGADGKDGRDGIDGLNGADGKDGRDGIDGEVPTEWITNVNTLFDESRDYAAAAAAMRVDLPQYQKSRLTVSSSLVNGRLGMGFGYAYMIDDDMNSGLTLSVGHAGSETAIQGSYGFEFGGARGARIDMSSFAPALTPAIIIAEPEPEPELYTEVLVQQQVMETMHDEDIEQVQMAQVSMDTRLQRLEQTREENAERLAAYAAKQKQKEAEERAYVQQTLSELEPYRKK
jgi:hypothetical protein